MLLSPVVTGHCQGQLLLLWQNPVPLRLRGYHPLRQHVPEHFSSENSIQRHSTPHPYHVAVAGSVWALPFSLAATSGISIDFSSSSYSDASLRTVRPPRRKQGSVKRDLIRRSRDHGSHAPTPGLSQLATSFVTYQAESSSNRRLCTCTPANTYCSPGNFACSGTAKVRPMATVPMANHQNRLHEQTGSSALGCWGWQAEHLAEAWCLHLSLIHISEPTRRS